MADAAYQDGNTLYKIGDLEGAEKSYSLASKFDPTEPKYFSNLSAVYYEQGRYVLCMDAIMNSWRALRTKYSVDGQPSTPPLTEALAAKLALRFLKAKFHSLAIGLISFHDKKKKKKGKSTESNPGIEQDIQVFCEAVAQAQDGRSQHAELLQTWEFWAKKKAECEGHTAEECKKGRVHAEKRLRGLPIFRPPLYDAMQYFRFGHDIPKSLFLTLDGRGIKGDTAVNEVTLLKEKFKKISFLYGGSGDGRQVYATMIHFADMWKNLGEYDWTGRNFEMPHLHLTLFDIHPAAVARVMLIFGLIRKCALTRTATDRLEVEATAFYIYHGLHIPAYCANHVITVSGELVNELEGMSPKQLTKLWFVDEVTKPKVLKILEYWSKPLPKDMKRFFHANGPNFGDLNALGSLTDIRKVQQDDQFRDLLHAIRLGHGRVSGSRKDPALPVYNNFDAEDALFQHARILLPPKQFLSRHPALSKYVKSDSRMGKQVLVEEIIKEWKPNPTLFDNHTSENPAYSHGGYPSVSFDEDPSYSIGEILNSIHIFRGVDELLMDQTAFEATRQLFDSVKKCFDMLDPLDGALTLEFVCNDLYTGLPKLVAGDLGPRPPSFPTKYLRMWLSNTPDYTEGILSNLVYLAPYLEDTTFAAMVWNCLLNTGSFSSLRDISINYTYLTATGIRRFFHCLLHDEDKDAFDEFVLSILPRTELAYANIVSKKDTHEYVSYLLLRALCCPRAPMGGLSQVHEPTNLVSFFRFLESLVHKFACPAHWLGDFVQSMIEDRLLTTATSFEGTLPITRKPTPKPAERKINLALYQLEIENILVSAKGALPFSISYPAVFSSSHESIKTYTARVEPIVSLPDEVSVTSPTANLLFYKASFSHTTSALLTLPSRIPELIESQDGTLNGIHVQIVSAVEEMEFERNRVSWKMSERWNDKMKSEGWSMAVWVTNRRQTVSAPVVALAWKEVIAPVTP